MSRDATKRPTGLRQPGAVERQPQWPALDGDLPTARFKLLTSAKTPASFPEDFRISSTASPLAVAASTGALQ
jgi:hypothetical protein